MDEPQPALLIDVALNPAHGPMLLRFAAEHGVELVWATTWTDDANTMIGPLLELPELPVRRRPGSASVTS